MFLPAARWFSWIPFLCFSGLYLVPGGYGQIDTASVSIDGLKSPDAHVRYEAAITLGKIKDPRAVEPLIAALKDADSSVRVQASGALGKLGAPAIEPLIAALKDADSNVRRYAAYALGEIKGARVVEPLIAALKDADQSVLRYASDALGKIRDVRAIEPLITGLNNARPTSQFWEFRHSAIEALVSIGVPAVEPLIAALKNSDLEARRSAAMVLGEIKDERAVARLLSGLRENDVGVIVGACRFFIGRGEAESEGALIQALNAKGDDEMAVAFLNSGNFNLEAAASTWASEHGYKITSFPGSPLRWGSRR